MDLVKVADVASIAGFIISLSTFIVVWLSKSAAKKAVEEFRGKITSFHAVVDFSTAITTMEEIKRLHREGAWKTLPDRYSSLRKHLISIRESSPRMSSPNKKQIQGAITQFATLEELIEKALQREELPQDVARLNAVVSRQIDKVHAILVEQENLIGR